MYFKCFIVYIRTMKNVPKTEYIHYFINHVKPKKVIWFEILWNDTYSFDNIDI